MVGIRMITSVLVTLLATWFVLLALLIIARPKGVDLREFRAFVPDLVRLISRLARDPSVGRGTRIRLSMLLGYLAFPLDLVPDLIPVLGYADDVIVVALALRAVVRRVGSDALTEHWSGSEVGLAAVRRLAGHRRT